MSAAAHALLLAALALPGCTNVTTTITLTITRTVPAVTSQQALPHLFQPKPEGSR